MRSCPRCKQEVNVDKDRVVCPKCGFIVTKDHKEDIKFPKKGFKPFKEVKHIMSFSIPSSNMVLGKGMIEKMSGKKISDEEYEKIKKALAEGKKDVRSDKKAIQGSGSSESRREGHTYTQVPRDGSSDKTG